MRVFIAALVLIFSLQSWTKADDIRDFQIEGMSLYDSALDYYTESQIKSKKQNYYNNKEFSASTFRDKNNLYDAIDVIYRSNDNKYTIEGLGGLIFYKNNINECYNKMKNVVKEISEVLADGKNFKIINERTVKHQKDKSGKSTIREVIFLFKTYDQILVQCYDWSKKIKHTDHLRVVFRTIEFQNFISNKAYK